MKHRTSFHFIYRGIKFSCTHTGCWAFAEPPNFCAKIPKSATYWERYLSGRDRDFAALYGDSVDFSEKVSIMKKAIDNFHLDNVIYTGEL